jgi:hypothetical protein
LRIFRAGGLRGDLTRDVRDVVPRNADICQLTV